jgi:hypothetical protein
MVPVKWPEMKLGGAEYKFRSVKEPRRKVFRLQVLHNRQVRKIPGDRQQSAGFREVRVCQGIGLFRSLGAGVAMNFDGYLQFPDPVGIVKQTVGESQRFLSGSIVVGELDVYVSCSRFLLGLQETTKFSIVP